MLANTTAFYAELLSKTRVFRNLVAMLFRNTCCFWNFESFHKNNCYKMCISQGYIARDL